MSSYRVCVVKALLRLDAEKVSDILAETFKDDLRAIHVTISDSAPWSVTYELRDWDFPKERDDYEWDDDESYDRNMEAQSEAFYDTWEPAYQKESGRMEAIAGYALASVRHTIKSIEYSWGDKNYFYLTVTMNPVVTPPPQSSPDTYQECVDRVLDRIRGDSFTPPPSR